MITNNMKPGHEERRRDDIINKVRACDYQTAANRLRELIADLEDED